MNATYRGNSDEMAVALPLSAIPSSGLGRSNGGCDASSQISRWATNNYTPTTIDGITLYDVRS